MGSGAGEAREHLSPAVDRAPAGPPLTVVVPVYNEGKNFRQWWLASRPWLPSGTRVKVVYDFEEDDTVPVVRELATTGVPVELLRNPGRGVLQALIAGLRSVHEGPVLVSMADLSDDPSIIPAMLREWENGAKVVVASRYMKGGRQIGGGLLKTSLSRYGGLSLRWLAGFPSHDATNSFRLYDGALVGDLEIESRGGFELGFEITVKAWMRGEKVVEVPTTWRDRVEGESRFNLRKWLPLYARIWWRALRHGVTHRFRG